MVEHDVVQIDPVDAVIELDKLLPNRKPKFLVGDLSSAEQDFEIVLLGEEDVKGKQAYHLRLTARPETESMYRQIDLWVDQEIWLPVRQELVELNNSVSRIDLENVVLNQVIEDSVFKLDLPSDVERVKG